MKIIRVIVNIFVWLCIAYVIDRILFWALRKAKLI